MEKAPGKELSHFWNDFTGPQKLEVVKHIAVFDNTFASTPFPKTGSLYFASTYLKMVMPQYLALMAKS